MEDFYSNIYGSRISLARFAAFASHVCWLCAFNVKSFPLILFTFKQTLSVSVRTAKHFYDSPTFKRVLSRSLRCKCPNRS